MILEFLPVLYVNTHIYVYIMFTLGIMMSQVFALSPVCFRNESKFLEDFKTFLNTLYLKTSLSPITCIIAHVSLHRYRTKTEGKSCWVQKSSEHIP